MYQRRKRFGVPSVFIGMVLAALLSSALGGKPARASDTAGGRLGSGCVAW